MNLIKLGKKGQVSIPQGVLRQLGIAPDSPLLVETTDDGAIVLRQVSVHPVEMYSQERLAEFERENTMTPAQMRKFGPQIANFSAWLQTQAPPARGVPRVAEPLATYRSSPEPRVARTSGTKKAAPPKSVSGGVPGAAAKSSAVRGPKR